MAITGDGLGQAVYDAVNKTGMNNDEKANLLTQLKITYGAVVDYLKANVEVINVKVSATGIINTPTPPVPVPTDGGAAILTTMIANTAGKQLSQSTNGGIT